MKRKSMNMSPSTPAMGKYLGMLSSWLCNQSRRREILNCNMVYFTGKLIFCPVSPLEEGLGKYIIWPNKNYFYQYVY